VDEAVGVIRPNIRGAESYRAVFTSLENKNATDCQSDTLKNLSVLKSCLTFLLLLQ
jgi:hypothetical protein